jgi:hypothetical protein
MEEVLKLPKDKKTVKKASGSKGFPESISDPDLRAAFLTLYDNDQRLARVARLNLVEVGKRLETLEAIVFAQSVLIADLRGKPLTPQQREKISRVLKRQGKQGVNLE